MSHWATFIPGGPVETVRIWTLNLSLRVHLTGVSLASNFPKKPNQILYRDKYLAGKKMYGLKCFHQKEGERVG